MIGHGPYAHAVQRREKVNKIRMIIFIQGSKKEWSGSCRMWMYDDEETIN